MISVYFFLSFFVFLLILFAFILFYLFILTRLKQQEESGGPHPQPTQSFTWRFILVQ